MFFTLFSFILFAFADDTKTVTYPVLRQAIFVSRHGIRGPNNAIPNKNKCSLLKLNGMVTALGRKQNFELGRILREDYQSSILKGHLSTFDNKIYKFYSTDEDKNLMSGQNLFQGLFYDTITSAPTPSAPIYAETASIDHILMSETTCATAINAELQKIPQSDEWKNYQQQHAKCFAELQKAAGMPSTFNVTLATVPRVAEQIILSTGHKNYARSSPSLVPSDIDSECLYSSTPVNGCNLNEEAINGATTRIQLQWGIKHTNLAKLRSTPYIHHVLNLMREYISGKSSLAFIFHIASNGNVQNMLQSFLQDIPGRVPFGSVFFFELWQISDPVGKEALTEDNFRIKIGYRKYSTTEHKLDALKDSYIKLENIADKDGFYTFEQIQAFTMTMVAWRQKCGISDNTGSTPSDDSTEDDNTNKSSTSKTTTSLIIVVGVLALLLIIALVALILTLICCVCRSGEKKERNFAPVNSQQTKMENMSENANDGTYQRDQPQNASHEDSVAASAESVNSV